MKAGGIKFTVDKRRIADQKVRRAAAAGLKDALEMLLGESNQVVPHEEGTLQRSGTVSVDSGRLIGAVSYDTPYAIRQHEDTRLRHDPGRHAKYLERTFNEHGDRAATHIAAVIRHATEDG